MKTLAKYRQQLRSELQAFYFLITIFGMMTIAGFVLGVMLKA
jgi:hypothetical protein